VLGIKNCVTRLQTTIVIASTTVSCS
jgi:hypothetical protein